MLPFLGCEDHRAVDLDFLVHALGWLIGFGMWFGFQFASEIGSAL